MKYEGWMLHFWNPWGLKNTFFLFLNKKLKINRTSQDDPSIPFQLNWNLSASAYWCQKWHEASIAVSIIDQTNLVRSVRQNILADWGWIWNPECLICNEYDVWKEQHIGPETKGIQDEGTWRERAHEPFDSGH